jgi:hypoxanthine phosphoribosyltransferase
MLQWPFPSALLDFGLGAPSAFSRLDLTHFDVLALGRQFMRQCTDRSHPIVLLGLRTGGTHLSALLRSFLKAEGYRQVASLTVQPTKGPSRRERNKLTRYAKQGFTALIVDDPPHTGGTIVLAIGIVRQVGFELSRIKALVPTHPAAPNWGTTLPDGVVITLEPQRWRKQQLLDPSSVEKRLADYFARRACSEVRVVGSPRIDELNAGLQRSGKRGAALKRIFEVQLRTPQGKHETRYVLAKGVGLGYLGYPAFLAAQRLSEFVPRVLGLRDGILYTEWLPQQQGAVDSQSDRESRIDTAAAYIAARTRLLSLPRQRAPGKAVHENGLGLLAGALGRAYGKFVLDILMRS